METGSLILAPDQYSTVSTYDLLCAAEQGFAGLDHRFLHALVDDPDKSIPDLLRFGLEHRENPREDLSEDLVQIFRHLRTPRAIPYLIDYFRSNHEDATIPVICAFQDIGAPAVEPLLDFYGQVKAEEGSDAAFLLGSLGVRDPRILDVLLDRLKIDPVDAGHCLAAYGDPAAIPAIRQANAGRRQSMAGNGPTFAKRCSTASPTRTPRPRSAPARYGRWPLARGKNRRSSAR